MLGIVYKATNLINGKLYVGKTTKTLRERYAGTPTVGWGKRARIPAAVRKYGWESFKFEVIDTSNDPKEPNGGNRVAVISHALWQTRYGGDTGILGKPMILNGDDYTIVGVLPAGFRFSTTPEDVDHHSCPLP